MSVDFQAYHLDEGLKEKVHFPSSGLIPAIAVSREGEVLMLAWMDEHALAYTLATRQGTYYSRSRQEYWIKGLTSGHTQYVHEVRLDCDGDTILLIIDQKGAACHTGTRSCFAADVLLSMPDGEDEKE